MTASERVTLVAADDHEIVLQGLQTLLAADGTIDLVGKAQSGTEAEALCRQFAPDVVLLDLFMPGMDGIRAIERVKAASPRTYVVLLTSYEGDEFVAPAIAAGALSYILKDMSPDDILVTIHKAAQGESVLSSRVAKALIRVVEPKSCVTSLHGSLSHREMTVLRCIAEGLSNDQIGARLGISTKTVKSHVSNVLGKLYLNDRTQAAIYAWRSGLVSDADHGDL
ncbi:MAG: response regulator transcription factor [Pseudomonadota bacterium]